MIPLVTVGIPFYNAEATLADAIRSVFAQTFTDWELLLIDDGSTDRSLAIAQSIDDPRVKVVSDGRNLGLSARLNQIAQLARGEFIARMDADDLSHPHRLEKQVNFLKEHQEVDVVGTGMFILDENGRPVGKRLPKMNLNVQTVLRRGCFMHPTIMGKIDWFRSNPYDSAYDGCEDRELWVRSFASSHFAHIPECLYLYREYNSFSLMKHIIASRLMMKIYLKYGRSYLGLRKTLMFICFEGLKPVIYGCAIITGLEKHLISRRSQPLTAIEIQNAEAVLSSIRSIHLPVKPATERSIYAEQT